MDPFILDRTEKSIDQSKALDELGRVRLGINAWRGKSKILKLALCKKKA